MNLFEEATEIPPEHFIQGGEYLHGFKKSTGGDNFEEKKEATAKFKLDEDD